MSEFAVAYRAACVAGALVLWSWPALADPALTLKRVMLSTGGVGYYEYEAEVDGSAELGLDVPLGQVDDVLKSLVVYDSAGGVGGFDLPGRDNAHAAFGDVPFGPDALNSPIAYLNALQGVEIEVRGPHPVDGRIMHAATVQVPVEGRRGETRQLAPRTLVTVMSSSGLQQFVLEDADSVQVVDPALRASIGRALEEMRRSASRDMRHITLHTTGTTHRTVRVGYVVAAPLWKATYRLILPQEGSAKARLQGWAVLENDTGTDWKGVELTLQSGNPVTFRQALYQTYYVDRPEVPVEVLGRILPPVDTRAVAYAQTLRAAKSLDEPAGAAAPMQGLVAAAPAPVMAAPAETVAATDAGEATLFTLPTPVELPAGHTASVPILDREVTAERLDLVQGDATHPLAAVRLTNDTGSALPAGVLTLYAPGEAAFAGDARLGGLPTGETRLLSFAEDLRTTVDRQAGQARILLSLTSADGVLKVAERDRQISRIKVTAPAKAAQKLLIEIPKDGDRTLEVEGGTPKGTEETATAWRVPMSLAAGETRTMTAYLDRVLDRQIALTPDSADQVIALADDEGLSPAAHEAIEHLVTLRQVAARQDQKVQTLEQQIQDVERDEQRLRANLQAVPAGDSLHGSLVRQLAADEERIAALRRQKATEEATAVKARHDLADAIAQLKL